MGRERVTNNLFADATDWNLDGGWSISGGSLSHDGSTGDNSARIFGVAAQPAKGVSGMQNRHVSVRLDVVHRSGTLKVRLGNNTANEETITATGAYHFVIDGSNTDTATALRFFSATGDPWDGDIDNVFATAFAFTRYGVGGVRRDFFGFTPKAANTSFPHPAVDITRVALAGSGRNYAAFVAKAAAPVADATPYIPTIRRRRR